MREMRAEYDAKIGEVHREMDRMARVGMPGARQPSLVRPAGRCAVPDIITSTYSGGLFRPGALHGMETGQPVIPDERLPAGAYGGHAARTLPRI